MRTGAEARRSRDSPGAVLPTLGGGVRMIDLIPWDGAQARYLDQSAVLASLVEQALRARVQMSPRPVQQAPFRVLVGANMPAVLVEVGYLSNADQEEGARLGRRFRTGLRRRSSTPIARIARSVERSPAAAPPPAPRRDRNEPPARHCHRRHRRRRRRPWLGVDGRAVADPAAPATPAPH